MKAYLNKQATKAADRRHPWVFSGGVGRLEGSPEPGDVVRVMDETGRFLAWGHYSASRIALRLLDFDESARVDEAWWQVGIEAAIHRRRGFGLLLERSACRLVFGEADGLPGLVADWYSGYITLMAQTPGVDRIKDQIARFLAERTGALGVWERSDQENRALEGLGSAGGLLYGARPPEDLVIEENGLIFQVDLVGGQKTGFFLDQRENRAQVARYASGVQALDVFSYTGAFAVHLLKAGAASVLRVESSARAAALGDRNLELNSLDASVDDKIVADAFQVLRKLRDQGRTFDLVVLDPPKLAPTRSQAERAARAYKDINLLAMKLLRPGGTLATFSCSAGIDADLFQKIVFGAGLDARRDVLVLARMTQSPDHPVRLSFPESWYLKGLIAQVV
jgi:23S rRNA (cytosine1962-C5)-methyltransferase